MEMQNVSVQDIYSDSSLMYLLGKKTTERNGSCPWTVMSHMKSKYFG